MKVRDFENSWNLDEKLDEIIDEKKKTISAPLEVKLISYFIYGLAGLQILIMLFLWFLILMNSEILKLGGWMSAGTIIFMILFSVILILSAFLTFIVGESLLKCKHWARFFVIGFSFLIIVIAIFAIIDGSYLNVLELIVFSIIAGYLGFSKEATKTFS